MKTLSSLCNDNLGLDNESNMFFSYLCKICRFDNFSGVLFKWQLLACLLNIS